MPPSMLPDELLEEIYLRLPPDEPACLVRASFASKFWLGLLTGPRFANRYRDFHRDPPMLGFCLMVSDHDEFSYQDEYVQEGISTLKRCFSTTKFGAHIPEDKEWNKYDVRDCRHGRVLLDHDYDQTTKLVVWDPMTGCRREMQAPENYHTRAAAVICTVTGCDHRACHDGPYLVVAICLQRSEHGTDFDEHLALTWSSHTGEWTEQCNAPALWTPESDDDESDFEESQLYYAYIEPEPPVLIRDVLYFIIRYPHDGRVGFLMYQLASNTMSVLDDAPLLPESSYEAIHMAMEDGSLGFAYMDMLALDIWSRQTGSDADEPWTKLTVIHLNKLLPIQNPLELVGSAEERDEPLELVGSADDMDDHLELVGSVGDRDQPYKLVGSVEGKDIIFVMTKLDVYEIDLKSPQQKKLCKRENLNSLLPYMSFYHPTGIPEDAEKPILEQDAAVLPAEAHSNHVQNTADASAEGVSRIGDGAD